MMTCRSAFRAKPDFVSFGFTAKTQAGDAALEVSYSMDSPQEISYSPFPADPTLIPVSGLTQTALVFSEVLGVNATAIEPVAHIRKDFDIRDVHFAEHEARQE